MNFWPTKASLLGFGTDRTRRRNQYLQQALDWEEDAIGQQSPDADLMQSMLDELASVADQLKIPIYLDSIQEKIDEIKGSSQPDYDSPGWNPQRPSKDVDGTDEDLRQLFLKLA